jgi:predicted dehydrogenase
VGHVERFNPAFIATKNMIENPMFIETHRLAEFNPRGTDVPVVLDLMIHDMILSVVQSKVKNISASGVSVISETPDIANARIEFENGCVANLTASRISMKNMRKHVSFKDAYISVDFLEKCEVVK